MWVVRARRCSTGSSRAALAARFVLRIEDTDAERSSAEMVSGILEGLRWLGLDWDEGPDAGGPYAPYFQSQRYDRHRKRGEQLLASGHAYSAVTARRIF